MMRSIFRSHGSAVVAATLAAVLSASPVAAQVTLSSAQTTSVEFGAFTGAFSALAQRFTAPADNTLLQSYQFYLSYSFGGSGLQFRSGVAEFSGGTFGPVLFSRSHSGSDNITEFDTYAVNSVNLRLSAGTTYAFVFWGLGARNDDGLSNLLGASSESFGSGGLFASNTGDSNGSPSGPFFALDDQLAPASLALSATFGSATVVPEPNSLVLVAIGCAGLLIIARRRRT